MSFRIKVIIGLSILVSSLYSIEHNVSITNEKDILNDINYTYNISDIKFAKSTHDSWENGKEYGYYTAIVYRTGLEHGYDLIRILVKKVKFDDMNLGEMIIIKDIQIDTPGIAGYISDIQLNIVNNKLSLGVDIKARAYPNFIIKQNILVDINGTVTNLIPFKIPNYIYNALEK